MSMYFETMPWGILQGLMHLFSTGHCTDLKKTKQSLLKGLTQVDEPGKGSSDEGLVSGEVCKCVRRQECLGAKGAQEW